MQDAGLRILESGFRIHGRGKLETGREENGN
jgi:hypothetical protein